ncbi:PAS domain S-box protein [Flavobacterium cellulosilyticum]|uniref:Sensory/regulatory protein RpfC n=1 Tax=Flavobacterium cellulosilyticum TaxID=2541731 RepID=A0A4R5CEF8_9FLAO|nr:PAS domain S-box protein [Flavobacterium cellulosilyticum]TDD98448.1 PAS domain S-box protein [Flavobacterium cellulosilyticum]
MKLASENRTHLSYFIMATLLLSVLMIFYYNNIKAKSTSELIEHTQDVIHKNDNLLLGILDLENMTRGYMITGNNFFLESFNSSIVKMNQNLIALSVLTKDEANQQVRIDSLKGKCADKLVLVNQIIEDRKHNRLTEIEKVEILKKGKNITEKIKKLVTDINSAEFKLLKQRKTEKENNNTYSEFLFFIILIFIVVIFTIIFINIKNLKTRNNQLEAFTADQKLASQYSLSLIEASLDPLVTISTLGKIMDTNQATVNITGVERNELIGSDFFEYFTEPQKAREVYQEVFAKGSVADSPLTLLHKEGKLTDVLFNGSVYKDDKGNILGVVIVARDIAEQKWAQDLRIANKELAFQNEEKEKRANELSEINKELANQNVERENREAELIVANNELAFQNKERENRANELVIANEELAFQNKIKEKRAAELVIANKELEYQNDEKEKRAAELVIANKELAFQNKIKEKRAAELVIANKELEYQNEEKEKRAAELVIANKELLFQNKEKIKRADELVIADLELEFQNKEKEKREIANIELEKINNSLKLASKYARSLIEASLDPLLTISAEGKITDVNNASTEVTGVEREILIGTDFSNYFTEPEKAQEGYRQVFEKGYVEDYPLTIKHLNGQLIDVLYNASVYKDDNGNVLGVFAAARDITDQKRIATELIEARVFAELATGIAEEEKRNAENATGIAENAVKAKQQFLSNMSHEIRTPMNAIIGFTKVVLKTDLTEKQKEYLSAIKMSGDALIVLINDILDLAKVDSGKMTFEKVPFKLSASVSAMLHVFETKIQEKNLELVTVYDDSIPKVVLGDPVRLHQIILNLVSNAIKFTSKGIITVSIKLINEDEESATIEFAVTDTGIGIEESKIESIFDDFQQATSDTSRLYGGTGLGLAIVKQLVEPQGGTISVKSKINEGTTFSFILSFKKTTIEAGVETEIVEIDSEIKNIKVLVVEDMPLNQLLMKTLLDDFGFERDIAENGKIAIEKLEKETYNIILMDLQMPVMNGFEATKHIRNTMKLKIPIIALTADVTTVDLAKCKEVGMNDYIAKPVDERILYSKIVDLVKKQKNSKGNETEIIRKKEIECKSETEKTKCINLDYLNARTKSNPKLMVELISTYLQQTPPLLSTMKQSMAENNWSLLSSTVHKIIPSFAIMGISPQYENMARKIQDCSNAVQFTKETEGMVIQIDEICLQACEELEKEFNLIKNTIS